MSEKRIAPSDLSAQQLRELLQFVEGGARPALFTNNGERIELPEALNDLFITVVKAMKRKETVFLMQENEALTTQAAADYLGVSRQYLVRLVENGEIPFHRVGTHRRLLFKDIVTFQQARSEKRRAILDKMTRDVVEAGMDDLPVDLGRVENEQ